MPVRRQGSDEEIFAQDALQIVRNLAAAVSSSVLIVVDAALLVASMVCPAPLSRTQRCCDGNDTLESIQTGSDERQMTDEVVIGEISDIGPKWLIKTTRVPCSFEMTRDCGGVAGRGHQLGLA